MTLKTLLKLTLTTGIVATLIGCGGGGTPTSEGSDGGSSAPSGKRQFINIGTAPTGGAFFMVGNAVADVVGASKGENNWVVSPEATKGTQENIRRLETGDIQFGMANAAISYFAVRGEGAWEKPHEVRAVATLAPNIGLFITTKSSGIKSMADLKGKRVVLGPAGAGFDYFLRPLLEAHGIKYEDLTELNNTYTGTVDLLADGNADAAFMGGAIPIPAVTQACASQDIVFIPFDAAALESLPATYPFYFTKNLPAGTYSDLEADLMGINVGSMQLLTHEKIDEETVYQFTKIMYENREAIAKQHPAAKALNPQIAIKNTGTPFHPGAIRAYKELGIWPAE
jgi:TRAP transporter TAXI family solute receptor